MRRGDAPRRLRCRPGLRGDAPRRCCGSALRVRLRRRHGDAPRPRRRPAAGLRGDAPRRLPGRSTLRLRRKRGEAGRRGGGVGLPRRLSCTVGELLRCDGGVPERLAGVALRELRGDSSRLALATS